MSTQTLPGTGAPTNHASVECRVWERFSCGLQTTCQPLAARGENDLSWPAQIRDLSVGGMGVVLRRRFERGAGLAVEIPESPSSPATTLLGRVVHTTSLPGGLWLHGCAFVSLLSEDELERLLHLGNGQSNPVRIDISQSRLVPEVTLECLEGNHPRRIVRRLHVKGTWPLAPGAILKVGGDKDNQGQMLLRVERCVQKAGGSWHIFYTFGDRTSPQLLQEPFGQ